jgi:hypothetical protein
MQRKGHGMILLQKKIGGHPLHSILELQSADNETQDGARDEPRNETRDETKTRNSAWSQGAPLAYTRAPAFPRNGILAASR